MCHKEEKGKFPLINHWGPIQPTGEIRQGEGLNGGKVDHKNIDRQNAWREEWMRGKTPLLMDSVMRGELKHPRWPRMVDEEPAMRQN